jgi:hypothetical protein
MSFLLNPVYADNNHNCLVRNNRNSSNPAENYDYNIKSGKHCHVLRSLELRPNRFQGFHDESEPPVGSCAFNSRTDLGDESDGVTPVSKLLTNGEWLILTCISSEGYEMFKEGRDKVRCVDGSLRIEFDGCRIPAEIVFRADDDSIFIFKPGSNDCIIDWGDDFELQDCPEGGGLVLHPYDSGDHTIKIIGNTFWGFGGCEETLGIKELHSMGKWKNNIKDMSEAFWTCLVFDTVYPDAFKHLTEVKNFKGAFGYTSLTSIPATIFQYNTKATSFGDAFLSTGLTSIPEDLFKNNTKASNFGNTFGGNPLLFSVPSGLFDVDFQSRPSFSATFYMTSVQCSTLATHRWWLDKTENEIRMETCCQRYPDDNGVCGF